MVDERKIEYRTLKGELRAEDTQQEDGLRFDGYAAVFNSQIDLWGEWKEQIATGAFTDAIKNDDVRALFNHDPNYVLARNKANTLTLSEDAHGLHFDLIAPDTQWVRDLHKSTARGDISQCSFAFVVLDEEWNKETHVRTIRKVQLFDVSIVTYPAYPDTDAHARDMIRAMNEKPEEPEQKQHQRTPLSVYKHKLDLAERS